MEIGQPSPGPGMAAVFRLASTINILADNTQFDKRRIRRMADRIETLVHNVNSMALPTPPPVSPLHKTQSTDSFLEHRSRPSTPNRIGQTDPHSPQSPTAATPSTPTSPSASARFLPSHLSIDALILLLERIKSFMRNNATEDLLRILGTRKRFEDRLRKYQGLVRTWAEECCLGIPTADAWDLEDGIDFVQDAETLKSILVSHIEKATGDKSYYDTTDGENDDGDSGEDTDDDYDFLSNTNIPHGLYPAAKLFSQRRLVELENLSRQEMELNAVFGNLSEDNDPQSNSNRSSRNSLTSVGYVESADASTNYSIHPGLEIKWLRLVLKALSKERPDSSITVSPYDLDEDGDGAPLGPTGISESLKGVLYSKNEETNATETSIVVIKKFIPSKRRHGNLLIEKMSSWFEMESEKRILSVIGSSFSTQPQILVTPFLKNGNILSYSKANPGHSLRLLHETAAGMASLHSMGILHGALRSCNVLVDDYGKPVLADFGLWDYRVEMAADGIARNGWRRWAAPEILRGGALRPQSDMYSFAMTMYEILTGDIPFLNRLHDPDDPESQFDAEAEESEITRLILFEAIRPLKPSYCPEKLWTLIESCWTQDLLQRPSFANVESQLKGLLKLQNSFRRQSQIKTRMDAFVVEMPLDDMMSSVLAVGQSPVSRPGTPTRLGSLDPSSAGEKSSGAFANINVSTLRYSILSDGSSSSNMSDQTFASRAVSPDKISLNLKFNLDSHPILTTVPSIPLGIDLPPTSPGSTADGSDHDQDILEVDSAEEWDSDFEDILLKYWESLFPSDMKSVPWDTFTAVLRAKRYPTFVGYNSSFKSTLIQPASPKHEQHKLQQQEGHVTFSTFQKFAATRIPQSERDSLETIPRAIDLLFAPYCAAFNADVDPASVGPIDVRRVHDMLVSATNGFHVGPAEQPLLHMVGGVAEAGGLDVLKMLVDERVVLPGGQNGQSEMDFQTFANTVFDGKGWLPLHVVCKMSGLRNGEVVDLFLKEGKADASLKTRKGGWTCFHIGAWVGNSATMKSLLVSLPPGEESLRVLEMPDDEGWTCLKHAARYGHVEIVKMIVGRFEEFCNGVGGGGGGGADNAEDAGDVRMRSFCKPALDLARTLRFVEVEALLEAFTSS
ncbi:hypothetical protein HDU81_010407 [Chytriomyces hyalinus]|nr:hypothetical protein HDU81_010407 [Chytriomyces hyalinus]